jgi:hypothetical protein
VPGLEDHRVQDAARLRPASNRFKHVCAPDTGNVLEYLMHANTKIVQQPHNKFNIWQSKYEH